MEESEEGARGFTRRLARFVARPASEHFTPGAVEAGKLLIIDTVAVAIAAAPHKSGRIVSAFAMEAGGAAAATILGRSEKAAAPLAAFANGTLANALDFDEGFHVATHVVPAALAAAEQHGLSGTALLDGVLTGYEVGSRLTRIVDGKRRQGKGATARGFWHVGLVGPLAAAAAVGRLLRLDEQDAATAFGIASCHSAGFRRNMGTMAKGLHSGIAARAGLEAVTLARAGFTADPAILESPLGFLSAFCEPDELEAGALDQPFQSPFDLTVSPLIKAYPACTPGHALIELGIDLHRRLAGRLAEIGRIEADVLKSSLIRPEAEDEDAAGFSGAYLLATALAKGRFGLEQLGAQALADADARSLMSKICQRRSDSGERVDVFMTDGERITAQGRERPRRLTTDEEILGKFMDCTSGVIGRSNATTLFSRLKALESEGSVGTLFDFRQ